jgi:hypothetical protein
MNAPDHPPPRSDLPERAPIQVALHLEHGSLANAVRRLHTLRALEGAGASFPVHRRLRFVFRGALEDLFDRLALDSGLTPHRLDTGSLLLHGPGAFVSAAANRKVDYASGSIEIWADDLARLDEIRTKLLAVVGDQGFRTDTFTIDWHFGGAFGLTNVSFDEVADPDLPDEAYPTLGDGVSAFVERYLDARDTVLLLQGPPGTGKTRLVRAILKAMSRRKGEAAEVFYTADARALEGDEAFVDFLTGTHDAFVIEDADHLLMSRSNGNPHLHRFLSVADGVVRAQGRKIVFTTNLPNVSDIDEALVRPGRCFAVVRTRPLDREEAARLIARVTNGDVEPVLKRAFSGTSKSASLASIYRAVEG